MSLKDTFYFLAGIVFLGLAKGKNVLQGYASPKPIDMSDTDRCIQYDVNVVDTWVQWLNKYTNGSGTLAGKNVLELGPGSDLGIGLYLLAQGCAQYNACDVNDLAKSAPDEFYARLFEHLESMKLGADIPALRRELERTRSGNPDRLNYVVRSDFDIVAAFGREQMDIVLSQAAFEHFDDVDATVRRLTEACRPGAIAVIQIDLKTHSRWIRDKDPNNIYRYPDWLYNLFWFRGIPNRVRPHQYKAIFEKYGWSDVQVAATEQIPSKEQSYSGMLKRFRGSENQMEYVSVMLCARL